MVASISDETKFGQIYAMEKHLQAAAIDCDDEDALLKSRYWAGIVMGSLPEYMKFLDKESPEHHHSNILKASLSPLSGYYGKTTCRDIRTAALATTNVRLAFTGQAVTETVMLARSY